ILDFYHASEYLADASIAFGKKAPEQKEWMKNACHRLKHESSGAETLLKEMEKRRDELEGKPPKYKDQKEKLARAITNFKNQKERMKYEEYQKEKYPIGSGVTEAACKTLIKERLCKSGMQWKNKGASVVIALRSLVKTKGRWNQFWNKLNIQGIKSIILA